MSDLTTQKPLFPGEYIPFLSNSQVFSRWLTMQILSSCFWNDSRDYSSNAAEYTVNIYEDTREHKGQ